LLPAGVEITNVNRLANQINEIAEAQIADPMERLVRVLGPRVRVIEDGFVRRSVLADGTCEMLLATCPEFFTPHDPPRHEALHRAWDSEDVLRWFIKRTSLSSVLLNDEARRATYRWSVVNGIYQTKRGHPEPAWDLDSVAVFPDGVTYPPLWQPRQPRNLLEKLSRSDRKQMVKVSVVDARAVKRMGSVLALDGPIPKSRATSPGGTPWGFRPH
jgi:hypothetical protein